jgi:hypothetical protein
MDRKDSKDSKDRKDITYVSTKELLELVKNLKKFYQGKPEEIKIKIKQLQDLHLNLETDIIKNKTNFDTNLDAIEQKCDTYHNTIDNYITSLEQKNETDIDTNYKKLEQLFNLSS